MEQSVGLAVLFFSITSLLGAIAYCIRNMKSCDVCGFYYLSRTPRTVTTLETTNENRSTNGNVASPIAILA